MKVNIETGVISQLLFSPSTLYLVPLRRILATCHKHCAGDSLKCAEGFKFFTKVYKRNATVGPCLAAPSFLDSKTILNIQ